jgi:putative holliday junction resolvase
MRILALDVGSKTIGVAVSDIMGWTAQGLEVIRRKALSHDLERLQTLIKEYEVEEIVVGLPKNMNGTIGPQAVSVQEFVEQLKEVVEQPVIFWDERLSTMEAQRALIDADVSRKKRKEVIDKMAAVVILKGYLQRIANR